MTAADHVDYEFLRRVFDALDAPQADQALGIAYTTQELSAVGVRLGKNRHGNPALIIPAESIGMGNVRDRHYANLRLRHGLSLRLQGVADTRQQFYSVAECVTGDPNVVDWFLRLLPAIYEHASGTDDQFQTLDDEIARIGELFRVLDSGSQRELAGLWAELLLIVNASNTVRAAQSWHVRAESVHDFTEAGEHVEVKCTEGAERRHTFSAGQLEPAATVTVASLVVEQADGPSVLDLCEEALLALAAQPELQHKVQKLVMGAVGRRLSEAEETRFDAEQALRSLRLIPAGQVPRIRQPFPDGVSNVHFTSDLSACHHYGDHQHEVPALAANLSGVR